MSRMQKRFLDCSGLTMEQCQSFGEGLCEQQRDVAFQLGDLARYAEAKWPDTWQQVFPEWVSPGLISRAAGVCRAYPKPEDRESEATYSQYLQNASRPDRLARLTAITEKGLTTDESRQADKEERANGKSAAAVRWLLAVDVNYFLHRFWFSGAGVEAAIGVTTWIQRTVERLKEKGLTDCACCFDSKSNHRKEFTKDWEDKYKGNRGPKEPELVQQLNLVYELLAGAGFACIAIEGYEADDCIASYAKNFQGKVAILSQDKDLKQCLSGGRVVMLRDVTWNEDETSGDMLAEYHWYTENPHPKITCKNLLDETGLTPQQFPDLQCLMGDATDCIKGAPGIGEKGAVTLMREFGSVAACIQAAHNNDERLLKMPRGKMMVQGLLELEPRLDVTRKLVTLVDTLEVPQTTRI